MDKKNDKDRVISLSGLQRHDRLKQHAGKRNRVLSDITPEFSDAEPEFVPADFPADDSLSAPSRKPGFQKVSYPPRISLNGLLLAALSCILLVVAGLTVFPLPSPMNWIDPEQAPTWIRYTVQLPLALAIGAFLGPYLGVLAVLSFLAIGLFAFPVFANGGGLDYVSEPGFGYLVGMLFGASLAGRNFHRAFQRQNKFSRSLKMLFIALMTVFTVHAIGGAYMGALVLSGHLPAAELVGRFFNLSVQPLPYDLVAGMVLFALVRQFRLALWLVLY